jgi:transcriptional regulator with XRE-family HTH domain
MTSTDTKPRHLGHNVKKIREIKAMKQEALAALIGENQQMISNLEKKEHIDEDMLKRIADALHVTVTAIKEYNEDGAINNNTGNNFNDSSSLNNYFHSIEKIQDLYERLLAEKQDKIDIYLETIAFLKAGKQ